MCQGRTVAAAVPGTAHGIPIAALLPPAAVEAAGRGVMRAVAVASHAALLIIAAWIHLLEEQKRETCLNLWLFGCSTLNQ